MFDNIGEKIKMLAKIITWIGIAVSFISGIALVVTGEDFAIALGVTIMVVGSLFSWIGSFLFYGFGQLVSKAEVIADDMDIFLEFKLTEEEKRMIKSKRAAQNASAGYTAPKPPVQPQPAAVAKPPKMRYSSEPKEYLGADMDMYVDFSCPHCGEKLSFTQAEIASGEEFICAYCNGAIRMN